ncbi:GGDEF domain-containing protein [Acidithrix ferrooxidans]|uniref:Putative diguanylate cyclase AdrA n=1 Tax=Acidithrix ferrooxidans TaxID=1280514 RepID=A0A0D8HJP2_9ACTN|nr:GGDEF domain-containing protein [Acidithrix ferrooxidans]KJF18104.1 putative diguanylate cyclase AdrA [Acidithrix ferrooxidans]
MPKQSEPGKFASAIEKTQLNHWLKDAPTSLPLTTGSRGKWISALVIAGSFMGIVITYALGSPAFFLIDYILNGAFMIVGFAVYAMAERIGRVGINLVVIASTSVITLEIATGYGKDPSILAVVFYVWVALYVFSFLSTAESLGHVGYIIVAYTIAIVYGDKPSAPLADWLLTVSTVIVASTSSGYLNYTIRQIAITDSMTSLSNRKGWDLAAPRELNRARRNGAFVVLAMIDMDGFKEINDTHGHPMGDQILIDAAKAIRASVRPFDIVARWGGDEFIFLSLVATRDDANAFIDRVVTNIQSVSPISCGAVVASPDREIQEMIDAADAALYRSKRNLETSYQLLDI